MADRSVVRPATVADAPYMVELSERYRTMLAQYQALFWSKAEDSRAQHLPYIALLLRRADVLAFVAVTDGAIDGFIVGILAPSPPVYAAGLTCTVDDFCVADPEDWDGIGRQLLDEVRRHARQQGASQVVVVCPHQHQRKRSMLRAAGLSVASEWYTSGL